MIVEEKITTDDILSCINESNESLIKEVLIFDVYRGDGVEEGFKSVALSLILQDFTQTLTDSQIDAIFSKALETLKNNINAKLRD